MSNALHSQIVRLFEEKGHQCELVFWKAKNPNSGLSIFRIGSYLLLNSAQGWEIQLGDQSFGTFNVTPAEIVDKTCQLMSGTSFVSQHVLF